jgi:uncharacterized membrane protein (UPF0127 family)
MELTLVRQNGDVLCGRCRVADSPGRRFKGLLGRRNIDADEGMLLATGAIHTSFMRFPIDVAFLDRNFVVLRTIANLGPWRVAWQRRAHVVVELPAGVLAHAGVEAGEQMSLVRQAPAPNVRPDDSHRDGPLRVAVASSDSRFLRVAQFLLSRKAFDVETFRDARLLMKSPQPSDVVVLDSSASLVTTARLMRELAVANPSTKFVVVGDVSSTDDAERVANQTLRVLPKWHSFDRLVDEIVMASPARSENVG